MYSLLQLVSEPGRVVGGTVRFDGDDLLTLPRKKLRRSGGDKISMIFQQPNSSLNPCYDAGFQIGEVYEIHAEHVARSGRSERSRCSRRSTSPMRDSAGDELPARVVGRHAAARDDRDGAGVPARAADRRRADHCARRHHPGPDPGTAAPSSRPRSGWPSCSITHELGVVAEICDRVAVMYNGADRRAGGHGRPCSARPATLHRGADRVDAQDRAAEPTSSQ